MVDCVKFNLIVIMVLVYLRAQAQVVQIGIKQIIPCIKRNISEQYRIKVSLIIIIQGVNKMQKFSTTLNHCVKSQDYLSTR